MSTTFEYPIDKVLDRLENVRKSGTGFTARCPHHEDRQNSLSVTEGENHKCVLHCFAGCDWRDVVDDIGLKPQDLFMPSGSHPPTNGYKPPPADANTDPLSASNGRKVTATYEYRDEASACLYEVLRYTPKGFSQRRKTDGGWEYALGDVRRVLYRLPELLDPANEDRWVFIVEGEKDVHTLVSHGFVATTNAGGAEAWNDDYAKSLSGRKCVVLFDNDSAGRKRCARVAASLRQHTARDVRVVELPGVAEKGDVTDWFQDGHTSEELKHLVVAAEVEQAYVPEPPEFPMDIFPEAVRRYVEETSNALSVPPEMVALPLMTMTGGLIGNRAHAAPNNGWQVYPTLYMCVVAGPGTSKSPAMSHAQWPLMTLQRDAKKKYDVEYEQYLVRKAEWKAEKKDHRGEEPRPPTMRHYFTTDITIEALAAMLEKVPGLSISSDELTAWVKSMNMYRKGADREYYLSIWATKPLKVDRKSGGSVFVDTPVISVYGGIQPDVVPSLHSESQIRDGFVERLLPFVPVLSAKKWKRGVSISAEAFTGIASLYRKIDEMPTAQENEGDFLAGQKPGYAIRLHPAAEDVWERWYNENSTLAWGLGGFLGGFYTKLEMHVMRFALILHVMKHAHSDVQVMISEETMRDAIELGEYFRGQMQLFMPMLMKGAEDIQTSSKTAGLFSRIERLIRRKGEKVDKVEGGMVDAPANKNELLCVNTKTLLQGLRNVRKEDIENELDTYNDSNTILTFTLRSANKPSQMFCVAEKNTEVSTFPPSTLHTFPPEEEVTPIDIPTPPSVSNGKWVPGEDPPW